MAGALRTTLLRGFSTTVLRTAAAATGETINSYGIGVSRAQGVVDGLTGGV